MKFTFKTEKSTGRYASFYSDHYHIKLNKVEVGYFSPDEPFKIHLQVVKKDIMEDGNKNCPWKWITLKKESETLDEAKKFLNDNFEVINSKYQIYIEK